METSLPLASDSFSYSWLSNTKSPEDIYSDDLLAECQNFNFDISITHSPLVLVPADEIFSDGLLKPMFFDHSTPQSPLFCNTTDSNQTRLSTSTTFSSRTVSSRTVEIQHGFLTRWRRLTQRTLVDFLRYVSQLRLRVSRSRKSIRIDDVDETDWHVKSLNSSQKGSPRNPIGDFHDHENSIYEAVLHCKRSIGK